MIAHTSWQRTIPQLAAMLALIVVFGILLPESEKPEAVLFGVATYLTYAYLVRFIVPRSHRLGLKALDREDYDEALSFFEKSYEFFSKHEWVDRYRAFVLMSPSVWTFREMALTNVIAVYAAKNDRQMAIESCNRLIREFPENEVAAQTLQSLRVENGGGDA